MSDLRKAVLRKKKTHQITLSPQILQAIYRSVLLPRGKGKDGCTLFRVHPGIVEISSTNRVVLFSSEHEIPEKDSFTVALKRESLELLCHQIRLFPKLSGYLAYDESFKIWFADLCKVIVRLECEQDYNVPRIHSIFKPAYTWEIDIDLMRASLLSCLNPVALSGLSVTLISPESGIMGVICPEKLLSRTFKTLSRAGVEKRIKMSASYLISAISVLEGLVGFTIDEDSRSLCLSDQFSKVLIAKVA